MFEHEDYLTPSEKAEILGMFRSGKWKRGARPQEVFAQQRALRLLAEEGLPATKLEKHVKRPTVSAVELAAMVGITVAAFFAGRWWARRKRAKKNTSVHGETNSYAVGALVLAS